LLGESEWALALPSVLFGCCALIMLWVWAAGTGRRIFGFAAVGLLSFNLYHVYWSQHPRMYSLLMFCSIGLRWASHADGQEIAAETPTEESRGE
jgi:4-amino-4-deoxy-L-arabinose transferase-like glycosyltransferase